MNMKLIPQIITKLSPTGLLVFLLALLTLIGFLAYFGNIAVDAGWFNYGGEDNGTIDSGDVDNGDDLGMRPIGDYFEFAHYIH